MLLFFSGLPFENLVFHGLADLFVFFLQLFVFPDVMKNMDSVTNQENASKFKTSCFYASLNQGWTVNQ